MPTLNTRENFIRMAKRELPEYIPTYNLYWGLGGPSVFMEGRNPDMTGFDYFGVEWYKGDNPTGAALPKPGQFILSDITKWRDVIKVHDFITNVDWDVMSQKDLERRDPELPYGGSTAPSVGFFEALMSFMGFDEGLMACAEDPDEVKALMEYLCDWSVELAKKFIYYYKPDFGFMADDIAHERNPFISLPMFQELFAPVWRRYYAVFLEADLPVGNHNCGHFEAFLPDLTDMGCSFWDPVQSSNDVKAIKARFGKDMAMCTGGPDMTHFTDETPIDEVRQYIRDYILMMAQGGGFAMMDFGAFIPAEEPAEPIPGFSLAAMQRFRALHEVFEEVRYSVY